MSVFRAAASGLTPTLIALTPVSIPTPVFSATTSTAASTAPMPATIGSPAPGCSASKAISTGSANDETFNIGGLNVDVGSDYLASLRGRVGYAFDRTLIFATGGIAFTQFSAEADLCNGASLNADQSLTGWTVGAGAEYAFTDNWIGRLEYRYYDFGDDALDGFGDVGVSDQHSNSRCLLQVLIVTGTKNGPANVRAVLVSGPRSDDDFTVVRVNARQHRRRAAF